MNKILSTKKKTVSGKSNAAWRVFIVSTVSLIFVTVALVITPPTRSIVVAQWNKMAEQMVNAKVFIELSRFLEQNIGHAWDPSDLENANESMQNSVLASDNDDGSERAARLGNTTDDGMYNSESNSDADTKNGVLPTDGIGEKNVKSNEEGPDSQPSQVILGGETSNSSDEQAINANAGINDSGASIDAEALKRFTRAAFYADNPFGIRSGVRADDIGGLLAVADLNVMSENKGNDNKREIIENVPELVHNGYHSYEDLYPDLYVARATQWAIREKTIYLTFDDGPTIYTEAVLNTLKEKSVKGTFFIVSSSVGKLQNGDEILNRIVNEGHTLAIHCNYHGYDTIYSSVEAYLEDFNKAFELIYEKTGVRPDIFRFPGGTNTRYNKSIRNELINEMERRGFTYYDWNASSGDSSSNITAASAYDNAMAKSNTTGRLILLMHDTKKASVDALPRIIDKYKELGFSFDRLYNDDKPIVLN